MGGIDYTKEQEITQDKMTDELFAAVRRGDEDMVIGITMAGRHAGSRMAQGAPALIATTMDKKSSGTSKSKFAKNINLGPLTSIAMAETLLFETNGNVELAKLLAAKLEANTLMSQDGVYGDDIAREMGAYGLSETVRQNQIQEEAREDIYQKQQREETRENDEKTVAVWQELVADRDTSKLDITPIEEEPRKNFMSKFTHSVSSALGLSKIFGGEADVMPLLSEQPTLPLMKFTAPRFSGPGMF